MILINKNRKRFGHWTLRYIYNRYRLAFFEFFHQDFPWLVKDAIKILDKILNKNCIGLEFGSGRSTVWFAKRVKYLISIESNKFWLNKVNAKLKKEKLNNVSLLFKDKSTYVDVVDELSEEYFDFVLVDGELRDVCAYKSIPKIKRGGLLIIDNINWFVPSNSHSPASRQEGFESLLWKEIIEEKIKNWKQIWLSNGVTDTLICFKS